MKSARIAKLRMQAMSTSSEEIARRMIAIRGSKSLFRIKQNRLLKRIGISVYGCNTMEVKDDR